MLHPSPSLKDAPAHERGHRLFQTLQTGGFFIFYLFFLYIAAPLRVSGLGSAALGPVGFRGHSKGEESGGWVGIRKEAESSRVMSAAVAAT